MFYDAQLRFMCDVFEKSHLQTLLLDPYEPMDQRMDLGLRLFLEGKEAYNKSIYDYISFMEPQTIYKLVDQFSYCYLFLILPEVRNETVLSIGPYLSEQITHEQILEWAENAGMEPKQAKQLETYYSGVPYFPEDSNMFAILDTFAEYIWGGSGNYTMVDINNELTASINFLPEKNVENDPENIMHNMHIMENRYAHENELLDAVSKGQTHKAEMLLSGFSKLSFESRSSDPIRNMKNYCIIMNTLLRKSAENGGVHPVYLDSISSSYAQRIEMLTSLIAVQELMLEMARAYCRLVRKHSMKDYSPPVRKAILYIDSDLTANLSLSRLASMQNISAGYLSALFKKETGQTVTDFVSRKRVRLAVRLLETTNLQIQTIAQHCGILDVHYFTKVFKKYTGVTPKEYRESR